MASGPSEGGHLGEPSYLLRTVLQVVQSQRENVGRDVDGDGGAHQWRHVLPPPPAWKLGQASVMFSNLHGRLYNL